MVSPTRSRDGRATFASLLFDSNEESKELESARSAGRSTICGKYKCDIPDTSALFSTVSTDCHGRSISTELRSRFYSPRRGAGVGKCPRGLTMATLQAATASTGATVTDAQAVRQLCEAHCFGTLNWEVDEEGELIIWATTPSRSTKLVRMDFQTTKVVSSLTNSSESWPTISNPVKNSTSRPRGTRSVGSRFWRSDTWFATARSSTRTSAPSKR